MYNSLYKKEKEIATRGENVKKFEWTVLGAGPAGIAAVGKLIDLGVKPLDIAWIDPAFKVGDLGEKWPRVSSNTKVKLFLQYLNECKSFRFGMAPDFELKHLDEESTCLLDLVAKPLQWVSDHLKLAVHSIVGKGQSLYLKNQQWELSLGSETIYSKNVIQAYGSTAKKLTYPNLIEIPLEVALNDQKINEVQNDTIAVFGGSHSAIIILQNLINAGAKKIINFYQSPLKYAVYQKDWILYDNTGLKGSAARWAKKNIDGIFPKNLERVFVNDPHFKLKLAECNKVIYAVGFESRKTVETPQFGELTHNKTNGIIAPGLFGLGIAFPERVEDVFGNIEYNVGLWKFMIYLNKVLPIWLEYAP